MTLINHLFEAKTLKKLLKACYETYTREAIEALAEFFTGTTPSLREVCDVAIDYYNANKLPLDDNVYLMTALNGKQYVGQTIDLNVRTRAYKRNIGSNVHWTRALKKYGFETFKFEHYYIPTICADIVEKFMILWYDLMNIDKGYNKQSGGKYGWVMSNETRAKMSEAQLGVPKSAEAVAKLKAWWTPTRRIAKSGSNHPNFGKEVSEVTRGKQRVAKLGKRDSNETRAKKSIANIGEKNPNFGKFGVKPSAETRKKLSIVQSCENNPAAKPVVVNGILYSYAREASKKMGRNKAYVSLFISRQPESSEMFKVSKEFYENCRRNNITDNITREMNENYYYFL